LFYRRIVIAVRGGFPERGGSARALKKQVRDIKIKLYAGSGNAEKNNGGIPPCLLFRGDK
jgi:hypothetical protein